MMLKIAEAAFIVCALAAIYLGYNADPAVRFWGCFLGLLSQPYWFSIAARARSWPVTLVSVAYTGLWINGMIEAARLVR